MIEIRKEVTRFYKGDTLHYKKCEPEWLLEQASSAASEDMRTYAAAGLMRALLDSPLSDRGEVFRCSLAWVQSVITGAQAGATAYPTPEWEVYDRVMGLPPVKGKFDAVSVLATKANNPWASSVWLENHIPEEESKLIIGLGHGGVLSSIKTYTVLSGQNQETQFYPVRFSRYKFHDEKPVLADEEIDYLRDLSADRVIVVHDEDRGLSGGSTLHYAVRSINQLLQAPTYGFTPALGRHPRDFWPGIIHLRTNGMIDSAEDAPWSNEVENTIREAKKLEEAFAEAS